LEIWPEVKQSLLLYENSATNAGNWIGFRFREEGRGKTPVGLRVTLHHDGRSVTRHLVTGDSYRSQHASTVHFGLGSADHIERAEIRWPSGRQLTLRKPALNRYHTISATNAMLAPEEARSL
jgi:hypothetical protein